MKCSLTVNIGDACPVEFAQRKFHGGRWVMGDACLTALAFLLLIASASSLRAQNYQVERFQLDNGLTVFLQEDPTATRVFGAVMVNAGGKHDPADATGIAHYLEHLLFKGTTELGTTDYAAEKPHLDSINLLYDVLARTTDEEQKQHLQLEINRHARAAAGYGLPNEFDRLLKGIGSTGVNAFTNEEMTFYHNSFPPNQLLKWLDIYAHRFQAPVFRSFQSELEVVYEEKNRAMDDFQRRLFETFSENVFRGHPYGTQTVLGSIEHLKTPSLTKMYEFFQTYYVADNMALILVGNFDGKAVKPVIQEKFGAWRSGEVPDYPDYPIARFDGKEKETVRMTPVKVGILGYKTVPNTHPDRPAIDVANYLLFNESETGLLNQLQLQNKLLYCGAFPFNYNEDGATFAFFVPKIIVGSLRKAERLVLEQVDRLKRGDYEEARLDAVKNQIYVDFQTGLEDLENRAIAIGMAFNMGVSWEQFLEYPELVRALTQEDISQVVTRYFGDDFFALYSRMGFPKKPKLDKPPYQPVVTDQNARSEYAERFEKVESLPLEPKFLDFDKDAERLDLGAGNELYVTGNPVNDVFTLYLRFHAGEATFPGLELATRLMSYSGTAASGLSEVKDRFAALGATYSFGSDLNTTYVTIEGVDANFEATLQLLNELLTRPSPDKQSRKLVANEWQTLRRLEKRTPNTFGRIMLNYALFGEESTYLTRPSIRDAKKADIPEVLAGFQGCLQAPASVHYTGQLDAAVVKAAIDQHLTLGKGEKQEPVLRELVERLQPTIYFLHDKKAVQSQVWFYVKGDPYTREQYPQVNAFNTYFGDGFSGLVLQEIREYRSLAYSAGGRYNTTTFKEGYPGFLYTYIGCQSDKTNEAIEVMNGLLADLPRHPDRMPTIRRSLQLKTITDYPDFRERSRRIEDYRQFGYAEDPNETAYPVYQNMAFEEITRFFEEQIQGRPVTITVYGDKRRVDLDALAKFGKVVEVKRKDVWVK